MNNQPSQEPEDKKRQIITEVSTAFSGPLPPPAILEHYEKILPGAAERIMAMAEQQSIHRRKLEEKVVESETINSKLGLIFGLAIGISALTASVVLALNGQAIVGGGLGVIYIVSLVGVFVHGSRGKGKDLADRRREIQK